MNQQQQQQQQQMMNSMNQNPPPQMSMMTMNQHQKQQQVNRKPPRPVTNRKNTFTNSNINPINIYPSTAPNGYLKNPQSDNLQMMMNQPPTLPPQPSQMMNMSYGMWAPPPQMQQPSMDQMKFQKNPNPNLKAPPGGSAGGFMSGKPQQLGSKLLGPRSNWKGKKANDKRRRDNLNMSLMTGSSSGVLPGGVIGAPGGGYQPPTLNDLQHQNRMKAKRFFPKKKFNPHYHTNSNNYGGRNMGKFAPRNTTSFLIRAKKSGGIAELVSPCPVTPAVLPTPMFSPSREVLVDMAKEEWGVDGYGSMKGLIRLRSPGRDDDGDEEDEEGGSSDSDVEEHVEVERRLDHDLSRFEMIYPNYAGGVDYNNVLENRVDDQDTHIAQLEEENLILKERLFLMERELGDLRRRMQCLERHSHGGGEIHEEVVENESENDSESRGEAHSVEDNNEEFVEDNTGLRDVKEEMKVPMDADENVAENDDGTLRLKAENIGQEALVKEETDVVKVGKRSENDYGASELKDENMYEDVLVKEESGQVHDEESIVGKSDAGLENATDAGT